MYWQVFNHVKNRFLSSTHSCCTLVPTHSFINRKKGTKINQVRRTSILRQTSGTKTLKNWSSRFSPHQINIRFTKPSPQDKFLSYETKEIIKQISKSWSNLATEIHVNSTCINEKATIWNSSLQGSSTEFVESQNSITGINKYQNQIGQQMHTKH
jgi:hypothetical protein